MNKYDQLREMRERQWKAARKLVTKPQAVTKRRVTQSKGGRPRIGDQVMTPVERMRRMRAKRNDPA